MAKISNRSNYLDDSARTRCRTRSTASPRGSAVIAAIDIDGDIGIKLPGELRWNLPRYLETERFAEPIGEDRIRLVERQVSRRGPS